LGLSLLTALVLVRLALSSMSYAIPASSMTYLPVNALCRGRIRGPTHHAREASFPRASVKFARVARKEAQHFLTAQWDTRVASQRRAIQIKLVCVCSSRDTMLHMPFLDLQVTS